MFEKADPTVMPVVHQSPGAAQGANGRPALKGRLHLAIRPYAWTASPRRVFPTTAFTPPPCARPRARHC
jgi:hypothetical protein